MFLVFALLLNNLALFLHVACTQPYSLYWSGHTQHDRFNGRNSHSFLRVWEAGRFAITATRVNEIESNIPLLTNPPGRPARFDGRLRSVSIYQKDYKGTVLIVGAGLLAPKIARGSKGFLLKSHHPISSTKPGSFWAYEESQIDSPKCIGSIKDFPGCFNSTDQPDNSSLTLTFPVGLASPPHSNFSDRIISVLLNKFYGDWEESPDYSSNHQNFFLFLLPRQLKFSINSNGSSLGTLVSFDWGSIEAQDLRTPPSGARDLVLVSDTSGSSLFVDGLRPFTSEFECNRAKEPACPTNCPESERGANGSFISRRRHALLCLNGTVSTRTLQLTCSVPCPPLQAASPRFVWLQNGTLISNDNKVHSTQCGNKTIDSIIIASGFYTETITLLISTTSSSIRIECRAFLNETAGVPCCNESNSEELCQPNTGIARVVLDVVNASDPTASTWCRAGGNINSSFPPLVDECPTRIESFYCAKKNGHHTMAPIGDSPKIAIIGGVLGFATVIVIGFIISLIVYCKLRNRKRYYANATINNFYQDPTIIL